MSVWADEAQPRTIVVDITPGQAVTYRLPPGVGLDVQSVVAEIDAAAGSTPELTVAAPGGAVITAKPQASAIAAGDTGFATWARRLPDDTGGAAPAAGVPDVAYYDANASVTLNARPKQLPFSLTSTSNGAYFSGDGTRAILQAGIYSGRAQLDFGLAVAFTTGSSDTFVFDFDFPVVFPFWPSSFFGMILPFTAADPLEFWLGEFTFDLVTDRQITIGLQVNAPNPGHNTDSYQLYFERIRDFDWTW